MLGLDEAGVVGGVVGSGRAREATPVTLRRPVVAFMEWH